MNLKLFLVIMTAIAVVSDSMLIPFYPQYFSSRFGITSPEHVGAYIAAFCFTVMLALPCWARVAKKIETLKLLVYTQLAAGLLSIYCFFATTVVEFWLVSLCMFAFKGSYLLMYPYVMSLEKKENHANTIGMLSLVVHFGGILGAIAGGFVMQWWQPRNMFLVMAIGDFVQIAMCLYQISYRKSQAATAAQTPAHTPNPATRALSTEMQSNSHQKIYQLGLVMLMFYFSAYLVRPFFALYWQSVATYNSDLISALVYAIPGGMALLALKFNQRAKLNNSKAFDGITGSILLGGCGLLLQGAPHELTILLGRCLFGWSLFQVTVRLDLLLFELSTPDAYASDFSKINIFQNLGVITASFAAGSLVHNYGLQIPFGVAAAGLVLSAIAYPLLINTQKKTQLVNP